MNNIYFQIVFVSEEDYIEQMQKLESIFSNLRLCNIKKDTSEGFATIQLDNITFNNIISLLTDADDLYDDIRIKMVADDIIIGFDSVLTELGI